MDLFPFKLDIDELIDDFAKDESTNFADMKKVWLEKKISFIYEAKPSSNLGFFMQSLYAHSIGHMFANSSLSHKLGGLFCLYCLHETQPFKPPFRIYLTLGELKNIKNLVVDAKKNGANTVSALVERMLQKNMFLFGFVDMNEGCVQERVNELTYIQNAQIQVAYKKLLEDTPIQHFLHIDMGMEIDLEGLKRLSTKYDKSKELAIKECAEVVNVENIQHISENENSFGDAMKNIVEDWNLQKESFSLQTGCHKHDDHVYEQELEFLLSES